MAVVDGEWAAGLRSSCVVEDVIGRCESRWTGVLQQWGWCRHRGRVVWHRLYSLKLWGIRDGVLVGSPNVPAAKLMTAAFAVNSRIASHRDTPTVARGGSFRSVVITECTEVLSHTLLRPYTLVFL